jgi:hypothetical protein
MRAAAGCLAIVLCWILADGCARRPSLGTALSDREFWNLIEAISEPAGTFSLSENFVSNEPHVAENVRWLRPSGGVYIGVGPEQNFSYIARVRPAMAFILDIRGENRALHFFYKALFELSVDRADFVSRLFSRPRPASLTSAADVDEIFAQFARVQPSRDLYDRTRAQIRDLLLTTHHLPLSPADLAWIDRAFGAFYADGPDIQFWGSRTVDALRPTYAQLMTARDLSGQSRSFLATGEDFRFVKDLQARNMIVPVVGDFGGPTAMRRVGDYVRGHSTAVRAFYGSNVGVYLNLAQTRAFCASLAALPAATGAWYIERDGVRLLSAKKAGCESTTADGSARKPR